MDEGLTGGPETSRGMLLGGKEKLEVVGGGAGSLGGAGRVGAEESVGLGFSSEVNFERKHQATAGVDAGDSSRRDGSSRIEGEGGASEREMRTVVANGTTTPPRDRRVASSDSTIRGGSPQQQLSPLITSNPPSPKLGVRLLFASLSHTVLTRLTNDRQVPAEVLDHSSPIYSPAQLLLEFLRPLSIVALRRLRLCSLLLVPLKSQNHRRILVPVVCRSRIALRILRQRRAEQRYEHRWNRRAFPLPLLRRLSPDDHSHHDPIQKQKMPNSSPPLLNLTRILPHPSRLPIPPLVLLSQLSRRSDSPCTLSRRLSPSRGISQLFAE